MLNTYYFCQNTLEVVKIFMAEYFENGTWSKLLLKQYVVHICLDPLLLKLIGNEYITSTFLSVTFNFPENQHL